MRHWHLPNTKSCLCFRAAFPQLLINAKVREIQLSYPHSEWAISTPKFLAWNRNLCQDCNSSSTFPLTNSASFPFLHWVLIWRALHGKGPVHKFPFQGSPTCDHTLAMVAEIKWEDQMQPLTCGVQYTEEQQNMAWTPLLQHNLGGRNYKDACICKRISGNNV